MPRAILTVVTAMFLTAMFLTAGCATRNEEVVAPLAPRPVVYDEALVVRDWPLTVARYAGGNVEAGPAYFEQVYTGAGGPAGVVTGGRGTLDSAGPGLRAGVGERLAEPFVFLGNLALLPYELAVRPPTARRVAQGVVVPPSYHAAPPLPESPDDLDAGDVDAVAPAATPPPQTLPAPVPVTPTRPATRDRVRV